MLLWKVEDDAAVISREAKCDDVLASGIIAFRCFRFVSQHLRSRVFFNTVNKRVFDRFQIFSQNEEFKLNTFGMLRNHTDVIQIIQITLNRKV